jgi:hypothetical protein
MGKKESGREAIQRRLPYAAHQLKLPQIMG